jgi:hypothetical protein
MHARMHNVFPSPNQPRTHDIAMTNSTSLCNSFLHRNRRVEVQWVRIMPRRALRRMRMQALVFIDTPYRPLPY